MKSFKKLIILSIFLGVISNYTHAQNSKISGEWLLEAITQDNEAKSIVQIMKFDKDGTLYIQEASFGTWTSNSKKGTLTMEADKIGGAYSISAITKKEMELTLENKTLYFTKINRSKLTENNKNSPFKGVWKLENQEEEMRLLYEFKEPDTVQYVETNDSYKSKNSGMWLYKTKSKELIIIGQVGELRGINNIQSTSNNEIILLNKNKEYILKKVEQAQTKIERLTLAEEDFYTENGDYKYEEEEDKLPWKDYYDMLFGLSKIKQLIYQYDLLEENTSTFETKILTAQVSTDVNNEVFSVDNIFEGNDRASIIEDYEFPENTYNNFKPLYPCNASSFRVIGEEEIKVLAGTFQCTVIEALGDFGTQLKVYMIQNQPGVIAKIISDKPDQFGHYAIYQLKEIQNK